MLRLGEGAVLSTILACFNCTKILIQALITFAFLPIIDTVFRAISAQALEGAKKLILVFSKVHAPQNVPQEHRKLRWRKNAAISHKVPYFRRVCGTFCDTFHVMLMRCLEKSQQYLTKCHICGVFAARWKNNTNPSSLSLGESFCSNKLFGWK